MYNFFDNTYPYAEKLLTQTASTEIVVKTLLYKKSAHKLLLKLTPECNRGIEGTSQK